MIPPTLVPPPHLPSSPPGAERGKKTGQRGKRNALRITADFEALRGLFVFLVSFVVKHKGHEAGTKGTKRWKRWGPARAGSAPERGQHSGSPRPVCGLAMTMFRWAQGFRAGGVVLLLLLGAGGVAAANPYLGKAAAIDAGEQTYREKCIICHGRSGGRGPDLFAITLSDEEFVNTVEHGRPGTLMPAFGSRLSRDDILKIRAFLKANPNGI